MEPSRRESKIPLARPLLTFVRERKLVPVRHEDKAAFISPLSAHDIDKSLHHVNNRKFISLLAEQPQHAKFLFFNAHFTQT